MGGFEACHRIKEAEETKDIPIIFLTARVRTADIVKGFEVGAVDYVAKPFVKQALAAVGRAGPLDDEFLADQLAENPRQALLGNPQNSEQFGHCDAGVAADKIDYPVVRPAEPVLGQDRVGLGGKIPIGVEDQLDPLAQLLVAQEQRIDAGFYVSHIDIYAP